MGRSQAHPVRAGPVPVARLVVDGPAARAGREVGAEETADHRVVHHGAAGEVPAVALGAAVARLDQVASALDRPLGGDTAGAGFVEAEPLHLIGRERDRDGEAGGVARHGAGELAAGGGGGPEVDTGRDEDEGDEERAEHAKDESHAGENPGDRG